MVLHLISESHFSLLNTEPSSQNDSITAIAVVSYKKTKNLRKLKTARISANANQDYKKQKNTKFYNWLLVTNW